MSSSGKIVFNNQDNIELAGRLEMPVGRPVAFAIFAHCFTCSKDIAAASRISRALAQRGFAVLRFDFTGLGNSDGDFANSNFSSNVEDLVSAAEFLAKNHEAPKLLVGHSLGGAAVLMAAAKIPGVKAVVTIGAPSDSLHVVKNFKASVDEINQHGEAPVSLAGRTFTIKKQFLDDISNQDHEKSIESLGAALLVFHSPQDTVVGIENAQKIYQQARHPKSFISLDGADHLLSNKDDSEYVAQTIASWVMRYLGGVFVEQSKLPKDIIGSQVVVRSVDGSLTHKVDAGVHTLTADEPEDLGGKNLGPSPYELLLAALGACTAMTLRLYSQRKKWDLADVAVALDHKSRVVDAEGSNKKEEIIERIISISGNLDDSQKKRLMEIADKCPVHKTLTAQINIVTKES